MRDMIMTLIFLIFSQLINKIHLFNLNTSNVTIILLLQMYTNIFYRCFIGRFSNKVDTLNGCLDKRGI